MSQNRQNGVHRPVLPSGSDLIGRIKMSSGDGNYGMPPEESTGATIRGFFRLLRRRWPILLVCAIIVPAIAAFYSLRQEKEYASSASLLFRSSRLEESLTGSSLLSSGEESERGINTNVALVSTGDVAVRTAKAIDEPGVTPSAVAGAIDVSPQGESNIASVTATTTDPQMSARIANTFAEQYIVDRQAAERRTISAARTRIESQLAKMTEQQREGEQGARLERQVEELETIATLQSGNAEVVQRAIPNATPVSPHPKRDTIIGLVVGIALGIALILALEQFDTRLKDDDEIESIYGLPLLAKVPHTRRVNRRENLDPIGLGVGGAEAMRMLHANLRYFDVDRKLDTLLITSAAPGDGKTTVSWGLAVTEARNPKSVLLIEADMRQPTLDEVVSAKPLAGLSRVLSGIETFDAAKLSIDLPGEGELDLLLGGPVPPNSAELLESEAMSSLLAQARERYDIVIIDTPPTLVADAIALIPKVSGVIVVSRLNYSRKQPARNLRELLSNLAAPALGVVVNDTAPPKAGYYAPRPTKSKASA